MKTPFVQIGISDQAALIITHVKEPGEKDPFSFAIPLSELNADGLDKAKDRIGEWTLMTLAHFHPVQWGRFDNLKFPYKAEADLNLISDLISKSRGLKTTALVPCIELLITELVKLDPQAVDHPTITTWPDMREIINKRYG